MDEIRRYLYGCAVSTFLLSALMGMGVLALWLPHWLVVTLIVATAIAMCVLNKQYRGWAVWGCVIGGIIGVAMSTNANDKKMVQRNADKPAVKISQLSSLPKGEVVKVQNARIPDKLVTTHSVRGKKTKQDQSPRTIYYHVAPLVDAKWKGASDPVVAWVKLSNTYSKRDPRAVMELITSKEGDDNAIKKTCTKHKLNCSDNPRLLRPLRTGFKASMLPTIMMYMSGIWVGCCGLFLLGVVVHTKFS